MAVLRAVQTGSATLTAGANTLTVTLPTTLLDTSKAFILAAYTPGSNSPQFDAISFEILSTTQIRFDRLTAASSPAATIQWYVVEFTSGVTVQRGNITNTTTSSTTTITAVNLAKAVAIASYLISGNLVDDTDPVELDFTNTTTLRARTGRTSSNTVKYQVIEFADSNVQSGAFTGWTTAQTTATITAVNTAKTLIFHSYRISGTLVTGIGDKLVRASLTNSTTITFDRSNTDCTIGLSWFAVEFTDTTTVQRGNESFDAADLTRNVAISTIDTARSLPMLAGLNNNCGSSPYSADDHPGVSRFTSVLTSSQLTLARGFNATNTATAIAPWQIAEFPAGNIAISGGNATATATTVAPSPTLGSVAFSALAAIAAATTIAPTPILGSVAISGLDAVATSSTVAPSPILGSIALSALDASASASTVASTPVLGSVSISGVDASANAFTIAPTPILGAVALSGLDAVAIASTVAPTPEIGGSDVLISGLEAVAIASTVAPSVILGSVTIDTATASAIASTVAPVPFAGAIAFSGLDASAITSTVAPSPILGSIALSGLDAVAVATTIAPILPGIDLKVDVAIADFVVTTLSISDRAVYEVSIMDFVRS